MANTQITMGNQESKLQIIVSAALVKEKWSFNDKYDCCFYQKYIRDIYKLQYIKLMWDDNQHYVVVIIGSGCYIVENLCFFSNSCCQPR